MVRVDLIASRLQSVEAEVKSQPHHVELFFYPFQVYAALGLQVGIMPVCLEDDFGEVHYMKPQSQMDVLASQASECYTWIWGSEDFRPSSSIRTNVTLVEFTAFSSVATGASA